MFTRGQFPLSRQSKRSQVVLGSRFLIVQSLLTAEGTWRLSSQQIKEHRNETSPCLGGTILSSLYFFQSQPMGSTYMFYHPQLVFPGNSLMDEPQCASPVSRMIQL